MNKRYNYTVEVFRFIFAVNIAMFHFATNISSLNLYFNKGYIGVEFFFLLSGYFMAESAEKYSINDDFSMWEKNINNLIRKIKPLLLPVIIIQIIGFCVFHFITYPSSLKKTILDLICLPSTFLFLRQWGFQVTEYMGGDVVYIGNNYSKPCMFPAIIKI